MTKARTLMAWLALALMTGTLALAGVGSTASERLGPSVALAAPPFLDNGPMLQTSTVGATVEAEAGIAAYFRADRPITIDTGIRNLFRIVEAQTSDYILGSMPVEGYTEDFDPKVYIQRDGWVMAYYPRSRASGVLFDWKTYLGTNGQVPTMFDKVLGGVASTIGSPVPTLTYYHFAYPNANRLSLVAKGRVAGGTGSFEISLPASFSYFERSWSAGNNDGLYMTVSVGSLQVTRIPGNQFTAGLLQPSQLPTDTPTEISLNATYNTGSAGLVIIYRVP